MFDFRNWFRKTFRIDARFDGSRRPRQRPRRTSRRLVLEQLEDRTLLSVSFMPDTPQMPSKTTDSPQTNLVSAFPLIMEPQITVNPTNPANLILSHQNQLEVSTDGGKTYSAPLTFPGLPSGVTDGMTAPGNFVGGDTTTVFDSQGRLFWANLGTNTKTGVQSVFITQLDPTKRTQIGSTYTVDTPPTGFFDDKEFLAADGNGDLFMAWVRVRTNNSSFATQILISRSSDQGQYWSNPTKVGSADDFAWPPYVTVEPYGRVYVAYHDEPLLSSGYPDLTQGKDVVAALPNGLAWVSSTWTFDSAVRRAPAGIPETVTTDYPSYPYEEFPGDYTDSTGKLVPSSSNNLVDGGTIGAAGPWVLADPSRPGSIYMFSIVDPSNGMAGDPANLSFARTTDYGQTWTYSTLEAGPNNSFQLFPTAAIDKYGDIVVAWLDNRNYLSPVKDSNFNYMDVYAKYSTDGGQTWSPSFQVNDPNNPIKPNANRRGDYFGVNVFGGTAYVAWGGNGVDSTGNPIEQIWTDALGLQGSILVRVEPNGTVTLQDMPNNPDFFEILESSSVNPTLPVYTGLWSSLNGQIPITFDATLGGTIDIDSDKVPVGVYTQTFVSDNKPYVTVNGQNGARIFVESETGFMFINSLSGTTDVSIGRNSNDWKDITGPLFVNSTGGQVNLYVAPNPTALNGVLQRQLLHVSPFPQFGIELTGFNAPIYYTSTGVSPVIQMDSGGALDVEATGAGTTTVKGKGTVVLGNAGSLGDIHGTVYVLPWTGNMVLIVDESSVAGASMTLSRNTDQYGPPDSLSVQAGSNPAIDIIYGDLGGTTVYTTVAIDDGTLDVNGLVASSLTVNDTASSAGSTITVNKTDSSGKLTLGGNVQIYGNSKTKVNIPDKSPKDSYVVTFNGTLLGDPVTVGYSNVQSVTLYGAVSGDYDFEGSPAGTAYTIVLGAGPNTFTFAPGAQGNLTLVGLGTAAVIIDDNNNTLTIDDSNDPADATYTITTSSVQVNGSTLLNYVGMSSLTVKGGSGNDTFDVEGTAAGTAVTIDAGDGNDAVNVGAPANLLNPISQLTVNGGTGTVLNLDDQANANYIGNPFQGFDSCTTTPQYIITDKAVTRNNTVIETDPQTGQVVDTYLFTTTVNYQNVAQLVLNGGSSDDTFTIQSTAAGTPVLLEPGGGKNTIAVQGASGPLTIQSAAGGTDTINLGSASNSLAAIQGQVNINGNGADVINFNSQGDSGLNYVLDSTTLRLPADINVPAAPVVTFTGIANVVLNTGTGSSTKYYFNIIQGIAAGTAVTLNSGGENVISVSNERGTLDDLRGPLFINGQANDVGLEVGDENSSGGHTYTLAALPALGPTANQLTRSGPLPVTITYTGLTTMGLNGSYLGGDTFNIESRADNYVTRIYGGPGDVFNVSSLAQNLDSITHSVFPGQDNILDLEGSAAGVAGGNSVLNINDQANAAATTWQVQSNNFVRQLSDGSALGIYYAGFRSMTVNGGSGGNTYTVQAPLGSIPLTLNGGAGVNTLQGPDSDSLWQLTHPNSGSLDGLIQFAAMANLVGGSGDDTFQFQNGGQVGGTLDGGGGTNTLDYSAYVGDVTVDLPLGVATGVSAGIRNIANVTGSIGNDLLVGDANPNVLIGGTGRNLIIGGDGGDTITGGGGDNLLIGGATAYDQDLTALDALFAEWTSSDSLATRMRDIRFGGGLNGSYYLNPVGTKNRPATVFSDPVADQLYDGSGLSWFFVSSPNEINNGNGPSNPNDVVSVVH